MFPWFKKKQKEESASTEVAQLCQMIPSLDRWTAHAILSRFTTDRHPEIVKQIQKQKESNSLFRDPIEELPEYEDILRKAELDADKQLEAKDKGLGFCHLYWDTKQKLLKENYGVIWLSPGQMNPDARFD